MLVINVSHHCGHWSCLSDKHICSQTIFFQPGQFPLMVTDTMCLRWRHLVFVFTLAPSSQFRSSQSILPSALTVPTVLSLHLKGALSSAKQAQLRSALPTLPGNTGKPSSRSHGAGPAPPPPPTSPSSLSRAFCGARHYSACFTRVK